LVWVRISVDSSGTNRLPDDASSAPGERAYIPTKRCRGDSWYDTFTVVLSVWPGRPATTSSAVP
jgi:hypothetical protein